MSPYSPSEATMFGLENHSPVKIFVSKITFFSFIAKDDDDVCGGFSMTGSSDSDDYKDDDAYNDDYGLYKDEDDLGNTWNDDDDYHDNDDSYDDYEDDDNDNDNDYDYGYYDHHADDDYNDESDSDNSDDTF